jgi:hypothetical protein
LKNEMLKCAISTYVQKLQEILVQQFIRGHTTVAALVRDP